MAFRARHGTGGASLWTERLTVAWWLWPVSLGLAALLATEVYLGAPGRPLWLPYTVLLPLTVAGLWALGRVRVAVRGGELWVDDAHLPVRYVSAVTPLDPPAKRLVLGPHAEPYAFVVHRPWVRGAVQVHLDDPADPTPYWVVSSRRPEALAAAIQAARGQLPGFDDLAAVPGEVAADVGPQRLGGPPVEEARDRRTGEQRAQGAEVAAEPPDQAFP